jgi:hypothetical protein
LVRRRRTLTLYVFVSILTIVSERRCRTKRFLQGSGAIPKSWNANLFSAAVASPRCQLRAV